MARWGLLLLVLSQLIGLNFVAWQEKNRLEAKKLETTKLLQQTFPQVNVVVNPSLQMGRQLDVLRQQSSQLASADFETLLSVTGLILPEQIQASAFQYQDQQLMITGLPSTDFVTQSMQSQATQHGYELLPQGNQWVLKLSQKKNKQGLKPSDNPEGQP